DQQGRLLLLPSQQAPALPCPPHLPAARTQAVQVLTPEGQLLAGGRALPYLLAAIGHPHLARVLGSPLLLPFLALGYRVLARHRFWLGKVLFRREPPGRGART
ncbi:MAG: DUF393 domain-containing protein, partial [Chloroflexi bacterium]|nr:DUF393 domain-containing protein [Chloroflexota bacterium]